jgi:hypothetical protein
MQAINFGDVLTCQETGKTFIAARVGCTTNYARDGQGNVFSDAGVDIRERKEIAKHVGAFTCYLSGDGRSVTGWKGNKLGTVDQISFGGGFGGRMAHVRVTDVYGGLWYGKGAGKGMVITLRPCKG